MRIVREPMRGIPVDRLPNGTLAVITHWPTEGSEKFEGGLVVRWEDKITSLSRPETYWSVATCINDFPARRVEILKPGTILEV